MDSPYEAGALDLARALRARRLSPVDLVRGHIGRIEAWNPSLNAVVAERFEAAMDEARRAERRLAADSGGRSADLPPLLGVPFTVKEFLAADGMPNTGGIVARAGVRSAVDAPVVARLKDAGAILLGVTNAPEGGISTETDNRVYGRTVNPWDRRRTSGGSSGGEGAAVGAGLVPFGVGSDLGGSIRIPAAFCGVPGHKPTGGLVPVDGHFPMPEGESAGYLSIGPLARRVADLGPLTRIMAGRPWGDPHSCRDGGGVDPAAPARDLRSVVVYPVEDNARTPTTPAVREAVRRATDVLRALGARVGEFPARRFRRSAEMWGARIASGPGPTYGEVLSGGPPISLRREALRLALRRSDHTLIALSVVAAERLAKRLNGRLDPAVAMADRLGADLAAVLGRDGVLVFPPYSRLAPRHQDSLRRPLDFAYSGIFNVLRMPATVVPTGFDGGGLPVSVQVVGAPGMDDLCLSVAAAIERECGAWRPPERLGRRPAA